MINLILFDDPVIRVQLLPFTFTRPVAGIRCGILTLAEKWSNALGTPPSYLTEPYLQTRYPLLTAGDNLYINGALCPDENLATALLELTAESALVSEQNELLALRTAHRWQPGSGLDSFSRSTYPRPFVMIRQLWDIFGENGAQIKADFDRITKNRISQELTDPFTRCYRPEAIFIEEGATIKAAVLNAEKGPIYIGKNTVVGEGSIVQGPFALGEGAVLSQGAIIRPNTTVGPYCKVGGEVNNSVLFGYSNKAHAGYLGNSVLGEWCNLGANTNNSNLKNDYKPVKLYNYAAEELVDTGRLFCGLFMGDYTKAGISTMFNTGTVVGVNVNVFGAGFQPKFIPSFTWGGNAEGFTTYRFEKAMAVARETVHRRDVAFGEDEETLLWEVFERTQALRMKQDIRSF
ncbi:putative sugar nucleotidyl transferase [Telluribacter sp.]|jgi:UDP-N-acetylglucosamine diphosphorylase/glucosamine-1-phosphate N-acetyltransferase|uniref:putative sugar nucleotidyl transferase n=1 Tax=Telluribacter sp. TaxID=1978767 RepID=UPI002E11A466|nr:putative sugar nucleotidyl transferase [Telluribacter sp.]